MSRLPTDIDAGWRAAIRATVDGSLTDTIEAALDEAEQRGWKLRHDADTHYDDGEGEPFDPCAKLNTILDKAIEMDRCQGRSSRDGCFKGRLTSNIGECRRCNGTGLGPIARMVVKARG